jgi:hypothetical protein
MSVKFRYVLIGLIVTIPAFWPRPTSSYGAHHATAAQYDISKTVILTGVVSKLDWSNPHVHAAIDVKKDQGVEEQWDVELGSPGAVLVAGLSKDLLKPGVRVTVTGYPGKSNRSLCAVEVKMADGATFTFTVGI